MVFQLALQMAWSLNTLLLIPCYQSHLLDKSDKKKTKVERTRHPKFLTTNATAGNEELAGSIRIQSREV